MISDVPGGVPDNAPGAPCGAPVQKKSSRAACQREVPMSGQRDVWMQAMEPLLLVLVLLVGGTLIARRLGYRLGGNVVVRCGEGHLFSSIWVPGASFKAVRLGWVRLQYCPVGKHWTFVTPVRDSDLTDAERRIAEQYRDIRVP